MKTLICCFILVISCVLWGFPSESIARGPKVSRPKMAKDLNPDPDIIEIKLVAAETNERLKRGKKRTRMWTYNGSNPGPTIEGKVGDTLIVHFYNKLSEETTVHWHGMDVPANMDGSNISQGGVAPGGYFRYEFKLLTASMYWYHPHLNTPEQVDRGLHGLIIVRDPQEERLLGLDDINEHLLVLDDILLNENRQIADFERSEDPLEWATSQIEGRIGNTLLVNGKKGRNIPVRRGKPQRLRLVNVSNSRFMRVSIPGHTMHRIGGDGGLLEHPIAIEPIDQVEVVMEHAGSEDSGSGGPDSMDSEDMDMMMISDPDLSKGVVLTPGERADVVFTPHGRRPIKLEWHDMQRGRHTAIYNQDGTIGLAHVHEDGHAPVETLAKFIPVGKKKKGADYEPPYNLRVIDDIDTTDAQTLPVMMGHTMPAANGDITFFVQAMMNSGMMMGLPWGMVTPDNAFTVNIDSNGIWEVTNMTGGFHNFHTHGFPFQLIETEYVDDLTPENNLIVPAPYREIKDTIIVPARPGGKMTSRTILRLAVAFDDTGREGEAEAFGKEPGDGTSGGWVFHCHILEHAGRGMISFLQTMNSLN
ncbi:MAG: multicopper oxidase family protein [Planctomycetes bacterium]|nr:multicopper oxidase family protein [Planctomycetota bacterium]